jgi:hypothetical protein
LVFPCLAELKIHPTPAEFCLVVIRAGCSADVSSKSVPPAVDVGLLRSSFRLSCWAVDTCSCRRLRFPQLRSRDLIFPVRSFDLSPTLSLVSLGSLLGSAAGMYLLLCLGFRSAPVTPELGFASHETSLISVISCRRSSRRDCTPGSPLLSGPFLQFGCSSSYLLGYLPTGSIF